MPIDQRLIDVVLPEPSGYPEELAALDTNEAVRGAFGDTSRDFPNALYVEPRDVRERAEYNDKHGLWAEDYLDRFTHQGSGTNPIDGTKGYSTHECTCHALVGCFEACWNRQRRIALGGPEKDIRKPISAESASVWMSTLSVYAEANPRERGGANVQQVIRIACERGFIPDNVQPKDYGFKHTMPGTCGRGTVNQSRGSWVPLSRFPSGWRDTSKHFMPLECVNPEGTAQYDSLLIHGYPIGIGRDGHSVKIGRIVYDGNRKLYRYADSYSIFRYDSRAYTSGAYSILSCTMPDDWDRPAG